MIVEIKLKGIPLPDLVEGLPLTPEHKLELLLLHVDRIKDVLRQLAAADPGILESNPVFLIRKTVDWLEESFNNFEKEQCPPGSFSA